MAEAARTDNLDFADVAWIVIWTVDGTRHSKILEKQEDAEAYATSLERQGEKYVKVRALVERELVYAYIRRVREPIEELNTELAKYHGAMWNREFNAVLQELKDATQGNDRLVATTFRRAFPRVLTQLQSLSVKIQQLETERAKPLGANVEPSMVKELEWRSYKFIRDDVSLERTTLASEVLRKQFEKTGAMAVQLHEANNRQIKMVEEATNLRIQISELKAFQEKLLETYNLNIGAYKVEFTARLDNLIDMIEFSIKYLISDAGGHKETEGAYALASKASLEGLATVKIIEKKLNKLAEDVLTHLTSKKVDFPLSIEPISSPDLLLTDSNPPVPLQPISDTQIQFKP